VSREKRRGGPVLLAGLGGFALGAATVLFVVWVYGVGPAGTISAPNPTPPLAAPNATPPSGVTTPPAERPPTAEPDNDGSQERPPALAGTSPEVADLQRRRLLLPVQGTRREQLVDSFADGRAGHRHEAIDIMAPRNTPVLAVEDGRLTKLFFSQRGGNTIYQFDPGTTYAYYYAHLERYADGLHEGDLLRRGQVIGYVGSSGNASAEAPHLHFAIFLLTAEKHWWQGTPIDPYDVLKQP
jgi:murein DD-endopeptidase MepM/ murein hydrolase activator NlpD